MFPAVQRENIQVGAGLRLTARNITTHHYTITNEGDSGDNSAPAEKDQESDSKGSSSKAESKAEDKSASSAAEKDEEPTSREVIIPDGQDEYELPII